MHRHTEPINWVKIFSCDQYHKAEIVRSVLEEEGLTPVIMDKKDSLYLIGNYEVHIPATDLMEANRIIRNKINF